MTIDPRLSFDAVAEIYHDVRPSYPSQLFDHLFELLPSNPLIVEVGPGTGQATVDLLARGAHVHAIELGASMAENLARTITSDRLRVTVADFETVPLPPQSFDALFSATAYHWIGPDAQLQRPIELLKRGALIAIVDLIQVESEIDCGFFAKAQPIYERLGQRHIGPPPPRRDQVCPPIHTDLAQNARFSALNMRTYDWDQTYTAAKYRKLLLSYSATQLMEPTVRETLLNEIEHLIVNEFANTVTRPIVVTLTTANVV
jgi:SAM-dependent methyltransferase